MGLAVYWPALALGTHWPKITLPRAGVADLDKVVHAVAFGGLAYLMAYAFRVERNVRGRAVLATLVAGGYAVLDEYTQEYFGRVQDLEDVVANLLGVLCVGLVYWAHIDRGSMGGRWVWWARVCFFVLVPLCLVAGFMPREVLHEHVIMRRTLRELFYRGFDKHAHWAVAMVMPWLGFMARPLGRGREVLTVAAVVVGVALLGPGLERMQVFVGREVDGRDVQYHHYGLVAGLGVWLGFLYMRAMLCGKWRVREG